MQYVYRRGPDAFKHLVDSLHDTGHLDLVRLLEPGRNIDFQAPQNGNPEPSTSQQPPADWNRQNPRNVISLSTSSLTVNVKKATEWRDVSLPGEPLDMKNKIQEFACREEHKHYDCCVVAIMSHGHNLVNKLDSTIVASDGQDLQAEWVVEQFSNGKARHLVNRPKIFFFQTCRGDNYDFGVKLSRRTMEHDGYAEHIVPSMTDVLICHSTLPGFISHRDMYRGTWYIEAICDVFMENAHRMDLERMMKLVSRIQSILTNYS
ncbi:hypothetical protein C0J52_19998 [Blattella germanica]|nr:hypothetical protein C0J52_19998 [Blattella germanica]